MVKVEGVSQQWCDQFGNRVMDKLTQHYYNNPDLSLDNFFNKHSTSVATGPVSNNYCATLFKCLLSGDGEDEEGDN